MQFLIFVFYLTFSLTALAAPVVDCQLSTLQSVTADYLTAQARGSVDTLTALEPTTTYTQNDKVTDIKSSIISSPLSISFNRTLYDTTECATYSELIIASTKMPYVIGTQIYLNGSTISKMQSLVTTTGDLLFNATGTLYWASREAWSTIPLTQRDTRTTIQAAADAYLDIFNNKSVVVPWGTPCDRLEGGSYTGTGEPTDSCDVGIPSGEDLTNRRYVIDETIGAVDVFLNFGGPTGLPDSHEFRIEDGKIRYVHTITVMH